MSRLAHVTATDTPDTLDPSTARYTMISSDCHAGANHATYREYLAKEWHDEFDAWRNRYKNPFRDLQDDGRTRNWDNERRIRELHEDGTVGEVVFPNTVPPFFPTGSTIAPAPKPEDYERRLAGVMAHNRWLVDFVAVDPVGRAGLGQIFLNDIDQAVEGVYWAAEHGMKGILLPGVSPDTPWIEPLYSPNYDPIWRAVEETGLVLTSHSGATGVPNFGQYRISTVMYVMEAGFFANRSLWHLVMSGVFERFPKITYVMTEQGTRWVLDVLERMDHIGAQMAKGRVGELGAASDTPLTMKPSDYFRRNCYIGASFPGREEALAMREVGIDRIMWGSDYPHHEATSPYSKESLSYAFYDFTPAELRMILSENIAKVYGFDLAALDPLGQQFGPTVAEVATRQDPPAGATSPAFMR
jgi:predicted TIM-barrel fold metal-dependent hydrolase